MKELAVRLQTIGKCAGCLGVLLVVLAVAARDEALLASAFVFLAPAFLMPSVVDWLHTRAVLAEIRSRHRASASTLPPPSASDPATLIHPLPGHNESDGWFKPLVEWDSPSRSIH